MRLQAERLHAGSVLMVALLVGLSGCAVSSRIGDYLSGMPIPAVPPQQLATPILVGLVLAMPETELAKSTAPTRKFQESLTERIQRGFQDFNAVEIKQVFPPLTLSGDGLGALQLGRLRELARDTHLNQIFVVVATSQSAQRVLPYPLIETQLFARMDLALVDLLTGRVLLTEAGQEDWDLEERYDGVRDIFFPRVFYRSLTTSGPFRVVDGDPNVALGEEAFSGAADQLVMHLRERLNLF